jgi:DNA polymerase III subunit gamma/tau
MSDTATAYRVLARKYRPQTFAEVIGQEAMVRTLSNAITTGRVAHAFMLTGVRGVGKTTTARIIARALNCIGPDGTGGPTIAPCGVCPNCRAIAEERYIEVVEFDAASHTGVDDIREMTEGLAYARPVLGRYRVYIIDEVHMLSKSAFNALLKTLEEPPAHVIFIFATTEVRRVPVTVLSRCQRFALRRVPVEQLVAHYRQIAEAEGVTVAPAALGLIARAADGSVRDGLSLLDQAIALGGGNIEADAVRDMLGIADRSLVWDLFETVLKGDAAGALSRMDSLYQGGADPQMVLVDLLELTHFLTRLKLAPEAGAGDPLEEGERERARPLAALLAMPVLARAWQMLLKGLEEVQAAPAPAAAASMVLVRLAYVADLPVPADLLRVLAGPPAGRPAGSPPAMASGRDARGPDSAPAAAAASGPSARRIESAVAAGSAAVPLPRPSPPEAAPSAAGPEPMPQSFTEVVALFDKHREAIVAAHLKAHVHLVGFEPGRIEIRPTDAAPSNLINQLSQRLMEWTGARWLVARSDADGMPSLAEEEARRASALRNEVAAHPLVRAVLDTFPGATIAAVRERFAAADSGDEAGGGGDEVGDVSEDAASAGEDDGS